MDTQMELAIRHLAVPGDILEFLDTFIRYGCVHANGLQYIDSLGGSDFRDQYRTLGLEEAMNARIGACIEQTNITRYLLTRMGVPNQTFCVRGYIGTNPAPDEPYLVHCFSLAHWDGQVLNVEHSDTELAGIYAYATEADALSGSLALFGGKFRRHGAETVTLHEYTERARRPDLRPVQPIHHPSEHPAGALNKKAAPN